MKVSAQRFVQKILGEGGVRAFASLFVLVLARFLGPEVFGRYSSALALASVCIVFVDLGTNAILTREIARHPADRNRMADASHSLKLLASFASWVLLLVLTYVFNLSAEQRFITLCLGIVVIGQTLTDYFSALLCGIEEMGWEAVLKILCRGLSLVLAFGALAMHQPLKIIVSSMAIGAFGGYVMAWGIIRWRFSTFSLSLDKSFMKVLLKSSLPLFGSVVFFILYDVQDILLLNAFRFTHHDVGLFSAAMKIIDVLRVYPVLLVGVFFPGLSRLHAIDPIAFREKQQRIMLFMIASLGAICIFIYFLSPWIVHLLYSGDYDAASHILRLLLPGLIGLAINHVQIQVLIALNQEHKLFMAAFMTCLVNLILGIVFISTYGFAGVCYALIGSEIFFYFCLKRLTTPHLKI